MANGNYKSLEKFAAGVLKFGVLLVFLDLLFIVRNHLAPFHFGKLTAFRIIVSIMAVFYVLLLQLDKKRYSPRLSLIGLAFFAYFGVLVLTAATGEDFLNSLWGSIERMGGLYNMAFYYIFFIIISGLFKTRDDWDKLFVLSAGVRVLMSFYSMGQMFWMGDFFLGDISVVKRPVGTTGNSLFLGTYLLWNLFITGYLFLRYKEKWQRILLGGVFAYDLVMFFAALARGAFIGLVAGIFVMGILVAIFGKSKKIKLASFVGIILVVTLVGSLILLRTNPIVKSNRYLARFSDLSLESGSMKTRLWTWSSGWKGFLDRPVFGYGIENFYLPFSKHYRPEHFSGYGSETWFDRSHNTPLDVLTETGIVGAISYIFLWGAVAWYLIKKMIRDRENVYFYIILFGAAAAYHVQSLTIFNTYTGFIMLFLFLGYVNFLQFSEPKSADDDDKKNGGRVEEKDLTNKQLKKLRKGGQPADSGFVGGKPNYFVLVVLAIVAAIMIFKIDLPSVDQNYYAGQATAAIEANRTDLVQGLFKKSFANQSPIGDVEIAERLAKFTVEVAAAKEKKNQQLSKDLLAYAIEVEERMAQRHPLDPKLRLILGRMYNIYWDYDDGKKEDLVRAEMHLLEGEKNSPSREQILFELGQTYVLMGDVEKGVQYYKKALDAGPNVAVSNYYYSMALFNLYKQYSTKNDQANAAKTITESQQYMDKAIDLGYLEQIGGVNDLARMGAVYAETKNMEKLRLVYEKAIAVAPNDIQLHSSLAVVYRDLGLYDKAREQVAEVKRLAKDNPAQIQEADNFLKTLK
jgi:O-antigen ligase/tetratricopeptide (TPR) repeat protein